MRLNVLQPNASRRRDLLKSKYLISDDLKYFRCRDIFSPTAKAFAVGISRMGSDADPILDREINSFFHRNRIASVVAAGDIG